MPSTQLQDTAMAKGVPSPSGPGLDPALQSIVEAHHEAFALVDQDFRIVAANRKYAAIYTGEGPEKVIGRKCHEISHKTETTCEINGEECPLTYVLKNATAFQVIHRHFDHRHDPDYVAIHGSPILGSDGKVLYMGEGITSICHDTDFRFDDQKMVAGYCPSFMRVLDNLVTVAYTDTPVLILGETGTGKELAARLIHRKSRRAKKAFVPLDCTLFTEEMFASELFGHAKGAYTGAVEAKRGLYEEADGGTLFLDEVGDMPLAMQAKFLRALEHGTFRRMGETRLRKADVRIICATNRDLKAMVDAGLFRADLYYRINCMQVELPPLRHRRQDIPALVGHFLTNAGKRSTRVTDRALVALSQYSFPGNVRELRNVLERGCILAKGDTVDLAHLPREVIDPTRSPAPHPVHAESGFFQMPDAPARRPTPEQIDAALRQAGGNRRLAAQALGISERTLYRKLKSTHA